MNLIPVAVALFGVLILTMSLIGIVIPKKLTSVVTNVMRRPSGMWIAVIVRLLMAGLLWLAADVSLTPTAFRVLAVLALAAAIALPIVGSPRLLRLIEHIAAWPDFTMRLWLMLGVGFGLFVLWSIYPALS